MSDKTSTSFPYYVIEDAVPSDIQDKLEELFFTSSLPWCYTKSTSLKIDDEILEKHRDNIVDSGQISARVIVDGGYIIEDEQVQELLNFIFQKAHSALENRGYELRKGMRSKFNVTHTNNSHTDDTYNIPHRDWQGDGCFTSLYFAEDSDGDFFLFSNHEKHRITPKKGRMILFDSFNLHAGNNPRMYLTRKAINSVLLCKSIQ